MADVMSIAPRYHASACLLQYSPLRMSRPRLIVKLKTLKTLKSRRSPWSVANQTPSPGTRLSRSTGGSSVQGKPTALLGILTL